jgi:hypothetical protein
MEATLTEIIDILLLGPEELAVFDSRYEACRLATLTNIPSKVEKYLVSAVIEDPDSYYDFLLDNSLSGYSTSFLMRLQDDPTFEARIREQIAEDKVPIPESQA